MATGFLSHRSASKGGKYRVQERTYGLGPNGERVLKHAAGAEISFDEAIAEGLIEPDAIPREAVQVFAPRDIFRDDPDGVRRLVARKGTLMTLSDLEAAGVLESEMMDNNEQQTSTRTTRGPKPRTAKVPAPES